MNDPARRAMRRQTDMQTLKEKGLAEANPLIFIAILYVILVGRGGLEPPTNGLKVRCSTN